MSTNKHIDKICIVFAAIMLALTVMFMFGEGLGITVVKSQEDENTSEMFTENDLAADWDVSDATSVAFEKNKASISGNGAYFTDDTLKIVYAGKYVLSGTLEGQIYIDADGDDKIWLMLDGVDITCDSSPIIVENADKVFITLNENSVNTVTYSGTNSVYDGAIYSRDDLTVNGSGSLSVTSENQHGIVCNDSLVFTGGSISVTAEEDAIHAHDAVKIRDTSFEISAGDDGIHSGNDSGDSVFYIESGSINITNCYEGIEANYITVAGGTIDIKPSDDGLNANGNGSNSLITISGGSVTILNPDGRDADGIDSNGSIEITGGRLFISIEGSNATNSAIDYGSENGGKCTVSGGTVIACGASGMAEGFEQASPQGFIMEATSASADTTVILLDAQGNELINENIPYAFTSIVLSCPEMKTGDTVTLKVGEDENEITVDNSSANGMGGFGGNSGSFFGRGGKGGFNNMPNGGNNFNESNSGEGSVADTAIQKTSQTAPQMPNGGFFGTMPTDASGNQNGGQNMQPPSMPDGEEGFNPNGNGEGGFNPNGNSDENGGFNSNGGAEQKSENSGMQNENNEQTNNVNKLNTSSNSTADKTTLIYFGVSVLVLAFGLLFAYKKKY